jgi:hypothetical protein
MIDFDWSETAEYRGKQTEARREFLGDIRDRISDMVPGGPRNESDPSGGNDDTHQRE